MIIPPGYAHVIHGFLTSLNGRKAAITYGIKLDGAAFGEVRATELYTLFNDTIRTRLTDNVRHQSVTVKYGPNDIGPQFVAEGTASGALASPGAPPNVAALVKKTTSLGGRANRGRFYLPGIDEGFISAAGTWDSGALGLLEAEVDEFFAGLQTLDMPMVILHTSSSDPTMVTSLNVDQRVATQRRRLR